MNVPFLDLKAQYESIRDDVEAAMQHVLDRTAFAGGPLVAQFEREVASFCRCPYAISVGSGTEALWLALLALGVGPGDEVITVPNAFIATVEAIRFCGAHPVFVDIDEYTYTMNPDLLESVISRRTKAILPVHVFGHMADMDPILDVARAHGLFVVEDACQAHGAEYKGRPAGSIGDAGCFSFYPGKNLGVYTEVGVVVTDDADLAKEIQMLRDDGQREKYHHLAIGWTGRMDGFQGVVLIVKLKHLSEWNEVRRHNAKLYNEMLADLDGIVIPREADYAKHAYHIYAIRAQDRNALIWALAEKGVHCGIHYPIPLHLQEAYHSLGLGRGSFPIAEWCASEFASLPMFPGLSKEQMEYVVTEIKYFYAIRNALC